MRCAVAVSRLPAGLLQRRRAAIATEVEGQLGAAPLMRLRAAPSARQRGWWSDRGCASGAAAPPRMASMTASRADSCLRNVAIGNVCM